MSDLGSLSQCMLENDAESRVRARDLRRKALVISVLLEAALLGAMLFWPLITLGVLPGMYIITPTPPYRGGGGAAEKPAPPHAHPPANGTSRPVPCIYCAKPAAPTPARPYSVATSSSGDSAPGIGEGGTGGPWIPGADPGGKPLEIKKPEPPQHQAPLRRSEGVMAAALIYKVQPQYPTLARNIHLSGTVYLRAIIATDGSVRQLEVISGNPLLANPALQAVRQWRYQPTRLNGEPVEVETFITVNFVLDQQ
ncbi:MAG TPA: energy transducer TonB [Candidatus Acidoferrales bacterium]